MNKKNQSTNNPSTIIEDCYEPPSPIGGEDEEYLDTLDMDTRAYTQACMNIYLGDKEIDLEYIVVGGVSHEHEK